MEIEVIDENGKTLNVEKLDLEQGYLQKLCDNKFIFKYFTEAEIAYRTIQKNKEFLKETDWIASKLSEAVAKFAETGDNSEITALRIKYGQELNKREQARAEINECEDILS